MTKPRYEIDGKGWFPIARAAALLRTNAVGVRQMMGDGRLDWRQTRLNSRTFVVSEDQVVALMRTLEPSPSKPPASKTRSSISSPGLPTRNSVFHEMHLKLTLPAANGDPERER